MMFSGSEFQSSTEEWSPKSYRWDKKLTELRGRQKESDLLLPSGIYVCTEKSFCIGTGQVHTRFAS